jgi:hypothetical protein
VPFNGGLLICKRDFLSALMITRNRSSQPTGGVERSLHSPGGRGGKDQAAGNGDGCAGAVRDRDHHEGGGDCSIIKLGRSGGESFNPVN